MATLPAIPPLTTQDPAAIVRTVEALRQAVEIMAGQRGEAGDRSVTLKELQAALAKL
jgi:hypothetical protein